MSTAVLVAMFCAFVGGLGVARVADYVVTGIATVLVFGRLGCYRVACCHGRHARWGVRYDERHVAYGLAARFAGRTLLPVQLFESAASAALAVQCAVQLGSAPGTATVTFTLGYAAVRFGLELVRGDAARPVLYGLSEAQWFAVGSVAVVAVLTRSLATVVVAGVLVGAAVAVAIRRHRPLARLHSPQHVGELDRAVAKLLAEGEGGARVTGLGFKLSLHVFARHAARRDLVASADRRGRRAATGGAALHRRGAGTGTCCQHRSSGVNSKKT